MTALSGPSAPALAAAGATLVAVLLLVPGVARPRGGRSAPVLLVAVPATVAGVLLLASPRLAVVAVVLGGALAGGSRLLASRRRRRAAAATSARVLETCELLAAELAAGQPPGSAVARAGEAWPFLVPVSSAMVMGADVPAAWRALADEPGAGDLRFLGAAWQVAHRTGEGLAAAVELVAHDLRGAQATRRVVEGELASARATARLIAVLPVLALAMGSGAGGDPWGFLLGRPLGLACLAAGLALAMAGLAWIEAIARDVDRTG